jgi:thiamine biosynthesis lipoprotein ApbE
VPLGETVERHLGAMGTELALSVTALDRARALEASEAAVRAIEGVEARLSTWRDDSELARLNRAPAGADVELSPELARDLHLVLELWRASEGAFDPGIGSLMHAFGLRTGGREPSAAEIAAAREASGLCHLALEGRRARRLHPGLVLEEGAFGKGVGLAAALDALRAAGATSALVDLGGQIALFSEPGAAPALLAVADPRERERIALVAAFSEGSLSTSGNSERGIDVAGERRAHIFDPKSGAPAEDFGSATVWAADPVVADAFSTALYALGPDAGMALAEKHAEIEALFLISGSGGRLEARATPGFAARVQSLDARVELSSNAERPATPALVVSASPVEAPRPGPLRQGDTDERLTRLEEMVDALGHELERSSLGDFVPPIGESVSGLGPAASKVYAKDQGLSIGGYGEVLYRSFSGPEPAVFDMLRAVFYFGYKFDENWLLNTEVEFEHGGEEVGIEFANIDYLGWERVKLRAGNVLIPMGFLNELHEPVTFLGALRPETERRIIPSTWHENGLGVYGDAGPLAYRAYVVNGFDASGFSAAGLRGGRQGGSEALAEDLALVARVDYVDVPGFVAGASAYHGDSGQGQAGLGDAGTSIFEVHGEWKARGLWLRGLAAMARVDDVETLNAGLGLSGADSVGEELNGFYAEAGYDVLSLLAPESGVGLSPYVRFESFDTQAEVPAGFSAAAANDEEIVSLGVFVTPIPALVFKAEVQDRDQGDDSFNLLMGYVF